MPTRLGAAAVTAVSALATYTVARHQFLHWGATAAEVRSTLPGDELLVRPSIVTTRAITIDAPSEQVWPWLLQMGQDRAGLYSYDWLENLFRLDFHNADRVVPEWQHLGIGDQIRAAPHTAGPSAGFTVVAIDEGSHIVTALGDPDEVVPQARAGRLPQGGTWTFVLVPVTVRTTRLVVRLRARFGLSVPIEWLAARMLEPVHFVMERKQLLGIRRRVSRTTPLQPVVPVAAPAGVVDGEHPLPSTGPTPSHRR